MTRTDVMASSRPRTPDAASTRKGSPRTWRGLLAVPVVLALALALVMPGAAAATESKSGYNQEPKTPKTGTAPAKEAEKPATTPAAEAAPATTSTTPITSEKASTLPFTGFDLRWDVGIGLLLMGAGISIVVMQRRQRSHSRR
jgi:hypothetical protein